MKLFCSEVHKTLRYSQTHARLIVAGTSYSSLSPCEFESGHLQGVQEQGV
jgi:hypothetical protein